LGAAQERRMATLMLSARAEIVERTAHRERRSSGKETWKSRAAQKGRLGDTISRPNLYRP